MSGRLLHCRLLVYLHVAGLVPVAILGCSRPAPVRVETVAATAGGEVHTFDCGPLFLESRSDSAASASHAFRVVNHSPTEPMSLRVKSKPCSCTRLELPAGPTPPGGAARVLMEVHAPGQEMARSEHVVLESDQADASPIHLHLLFQSMLRLEGTLSEGPEPRRLVIEPGAVVKLRFSVIARQAADEPRAEIRAVASGARATVGRPLSVAETSSESSSRRELAFELQIDARGVDVTDPELWRDHEGEVRIAHGSRQIVQPFSWRIRSEIEASPKAVFLHPSAQSVAERVVTLKGSEPFEVLESAGLPDWLTVATDSTVHGRIQTLRIAVDAVRAQGSRLGETTVQLTTSHPRQPALYLPMYILWPAETVAAMDRPGDP